MRIHANLNFRARARLWLSGIDDHRIEIVAVALALTWASMAFIGGGR